MLDAESPVPVINLKDGTRLAGDDAPKRKDLERWLKEHPGYVEDLGACIPVSIPFSSTSAKQQNISHKIHFNWYCMFHGITLSFFVLFCCLGKKMSVFSYTFELYKPFIYFPSFQI